MVNYVLKGLETVIESIIPNYIVIIITAWVWLKFN